MPTPRMTNQVRQTHKPIASLPGDDASVFITQEVVEGPAVGLGGFYYIKGTATPTRQPVQLQTGQSVSVMWKKAKPFMILDTQQPPGSGHDVAGGGFVVEELWNGQRPDGVWDVYFRNAYETVPLGLDKLVPGAGWHNAVPVWGAGQNRFYANAEDGKTYVFKLARNPYKPFEGSGAPGRVAMEYVFDGSGDTTVLATVGSQVFSLSNLTPPGPASMATVGSLLDEDGGFILTLRLQIDFTVGTNPVVPHNPGDLFTTEFTQAGTFQYPIVYDAKNKVVLLSAYDNPSVLGASFPAMPAWAGSFAANVTWTLQGTFTTDARNAARSPFPPVGTVISQYCGKGTTPGVVSLQLAPTFVAGKTQADRARGWIACYQDECQTWSGQSSVPFGGGFAGTYGYVVPFPDQMPSTCADVGSTFTPARVAAGARAPLTGAVVMAIPLQDQPGASRNGVGFVAMSTLNRLVWRATINGQVSMQVDLDAGGSDSEGFVTFYGAAGEPPVTRHLAGTGSSGTSGIRGSLGAHAVYILPSDFAYQADNPRIAFKKGARVNYFLAFWPFAHDGAPPNIDALAVSPDQSHNLPFVPGADYPPEAALHEVEKLAALPAGVAVPVSLSGLGFSIQVVNDSLNLTGHYEPLTIK